MAIKSFEQFKEGMETKEFEPISNNTSNGEDFDKWLIEESWKDEDKQIQNN